MAASGSSHYHRRAVILAEFLGDCLRAWDTAAEEFKKQSADDEFGAPVAAKGRVGKIIKHGPSK